MMDQQEDGAIPNSRTIALALFAFARDPAAGSHRAATIVRAISLLRCPTRMLTFSCMRAVGHTQRKTIRRQLQQYAQEGMLNSTPHLGEDMAATDGRALLIWTGTGRTQPIQ